jgi:hypothetical protein
MASATTTAECENPRPSGSPGLHSAPGDAAPGGDALGGGRFREHLGHLGRIQGETPGRRADAALLELLALRIDQPERHVDESLAAVLRRKRERRQAKRRNQRAGGAGETLAGRFIGERRTALQGPLGDDAAFQDHAARRPAGLGG